MLEISKAFWRRTLAALGPHIRAGVPVVGVEPSCIAAFRDELAGSFGFERGHHEISLQIGEHKLMPLVVLDGGGSRKRALAGVAAATVVGIAAWKR